VESISGGMSTLGTVIVAADRVGDEGCEKLEVGVAEEVVESTEYLRYRLDGGENEIGLVGGLECVVLGSDEHLKGGGLVRVERIGLTMLE
jgi:hypothetical protein